MIKDNDRPARYLFIDNPHLYRRLFMYYFMIGISMILSLSQAMDTKDIFQEEQQSMSYFESIPDEMKVHIIHYLPIPVQERFKEVSTHCRDLVNNPKGRTKSLEDFKSSYQKDFLYANKYASGILNESLHSCDVEVKDLNPLTIWKLYSSLTGEHTLIQSPESMNLDAPYFQWTKQVNGLLQFLSYHHEVKKRETVRTYQKAIETF